eukprot:3511605-Pyramimonas_sp.AAC.1
MTCRCEVSGTFGSIIGNDKHNLHKKTGFDSYGLCDPAKMGLLLAPTGESRSATQYQEMHIYTDGSHYEAKGDDDESES